VRGAEGRRSSSRSRPSQGDPSEHELIGLQNGGLSNFSSSVTCRRVSASNVDSLWRGSSTDLKFDFESLDHLVMCATYSSKISASESMSGQQLARHKFRCHSSVQVHSGGQWILCLEIKIFIDIIFMLIFYDILVKNIL
jgi:hypothetical protein